MQKSKVILLAIILIAGFLRFYNLNFGAPYFFHPDERNMASAITKFSFPEQMNPRFFAYGQFPLYLAYFSERDGNVTFPQAIFWLRFWSATTSVLTIIIVYKITFQLLNRQKYALPAALFAAFSPGLIQSAHFGTTESLLTFFFLLIIYLSLTLQGQTLRALILGIVTGIAIATKVSALIFIAIPIISILILKIKTFKKIILLLILIIFSLLTSAIFSPYNLLDLKEFRGSMNYESSVATGKSRVFYTRQFENTIPILFQIEKLFPYALGIPIFIFGLLGLLFMFTKSKTYFILTLSFLIYFLPNAFLFAKWTRFMTPVLPLFSVFAAYFLFIISKSKVQISNQIQSSNFKNNYLKLNWILDFGFWILILLSIIPGIMFFSIYLRPDIRVTASEWIYNNVPSGSYVLSETANVIDIPLSPSPFPLHPISFNFYELDENPLRLNELVKHLEKADYVFIPSRRIFANHMRLPDRYPLTSRYYELLFSGKLGFEKISKLFVLNDEGAEETFSVFDHPVIRVYKKTRNLSPQQYQELFNLPTSV